MERPRGASSAGYADIIADGRPREASVPLRLVRDSGQAQASPKSIGGSGGYGAAAGHPRAALLRSRGGDWCEWQSDRYFGGFTKTFRIEAYQIDKDWRIKLTLREIAASVFADDIVYQADQSNVAMTVPPPAIGEPDGGAWTLSATTLDSAGASVPAWSSRAARPTTPMPKRSRSNTGSPTASQIRPSIPIPCRGRRSALIRRTLRPSSFQRLTGGADYYAAISYVVSGQQGERLVLGPVTAGDLNISPQLRLTIDVVTGTSYTIAADDAWHHKRFTDGSLVTVTVPTNATAAYPIGGRTRLTQVGGGQIEFAPEDGTVTLNSRDGALRSTAQFAVFEIEKVDTNEWDVLGDVTT
jgi:hypothetical protein